ncbi:MAG: SRPBCC domain-containing protein [Bradyrhizobiaceae bacterium]|nr:MAG: SRPBCC domain-containing protein [Bradyrhizobiaceae bacterium]
MSASNTVAGSFVISRTFNAPRETVWQAWTERDAMAQWWGPKGCPVSVKTFDPKPGGMFHYSMALPNCDPWWGRFVYREIEKPSRLVFVSSFSDEKGGVTRAPFSPHWPLEVLNEVTLTESGGKTTIRLEGRPVKPTSEEAAAFEGMFPSMEQGFGGTFDQLADYLASR